MKDAKGHGSDAHQEGVASAVRGSAAIAKLEKRRAYLIEKERLIRASALSDKAHEFAVLKLEWEDLQGRITKTLRRQATKGNV